MGIQAFSTRGGGELRANAARRRFAALLGVLVLGLLSVGASGVAQAKVVTDPVTHRHFGILPRVSASGARQSALTSSSTSMTCFTLDCTALALQTTGSGQAVQHGENDYLVFWDPSAALPSNYKTGMTAWLDDAAAADGRADNPFSVTTQYFDLSGAGGSRSYVPYAMHDSGALTDTDAYPRSGCSDSDGTSTLPTCLTDYQIRSELANFVSAHSLPVNLNTQYIVLTPAGVGSCFDSTSSTCAYTPDTGYCAYHGEMSTRQGSATYANMPWLSGTGCDGPSGPNASLGIDADVNALSHELSETMTDPVPGLGWMDGSGNEIGDKCAYMYNYSGSFEDTTGLPSDASGNWDVRLGSAPDMYMLQQEYDNRILGCAPRMTEGWSGQGSTGASGWSNASNWSAGVVPGAGAGSAAATVDTLSFPALSGSPCGATTPTGTCFTATNDLASLSTRGLQIDDGSGYAIGGKAIGLGADGISATTSATTAQPSAVNLPLNLTAAQTWSVDGGASHVGSLRLVGAVSGAGDALTVDLKNAGSLSFAGSAEAGPMWITGSSSSDTGAAAGGNGVVTIAGSLNGTSHNAVGVTDAELAIPGTATIGPLSAAGANIELGAAAAPAGSLSVNGGLTLDGASRLGLHILDSGTTAGTDYTQVTSSGAVNLAGTLSLSAGSPCPTLTPGAVYTLISTSGSLSGTFAGISNGATVPLNCTGTEPTVVINYTGQGMYATVYPQPAPTSSAPPTISGSAIQGQTLTENRGTWSGFPTGYSVQWEECDTAGANCTLIAGATGQTYTLGTGDVGHTIRVLETAANSTGESSPVASGATAVVQPPPSPATTATTPATTATAPATTATAPATTATSTTVTATPPAPPRAALAGAITVKGTVAKLPVSCAGAAGTSCSVTIALRVIEHLKRGKIVSLSAAGATSGRGVRTVLLATQRLSLGAGHRIVVSVPLNSTGKNLLGGRRALNVTLRLQSGQSLVASRGVTFHRPVRPRRRRP